MSTSTTNLDLIKPDERELYDIAVFNGNADKIDQFAGAVAGMIAGKADLSALAAVATSGAYSDLIGKPVIDAALDAESTNAIQNAAVAAALLGFFPLTVGTEIPSTVTALSQLKQAGVFSKYSGFSGAFSDLPTNWGTCTAGNVIVLPTAVEWRFRQILLPAAVVSSAPPPYFWMRFMTGGTKTNPSAAVWQPWVEFAGTVLA